MKDQPDEQNEALSFFEAMKGVQQHKHDKADLSAQKLKISLISIIDAKPQRWKTRK